MRTFLAALPLFASLAFLPVGCASKPRPADEPQPAVMRATPPQEPLPPLPSPPAPETLIRLPSGIVVDRVAREVRLPARVAITRGWLEQVACRSGSREHESLLVVEIAPSDVHAALLLLGLEPGRPGAWHYDPDNGDVRTIAPIGPPIEPIVRWTQEEGPREQLLVEWIRGADGRAFPAEWVFAGSLFAENPPSWKEPGRHYAADLTGSLIGLVTFGDETIAARVVVPDLIDVEAANWEAWTERMPASDSEVTLVLRAANEAGTGAR